MSSYIDKPLSLVERKKQQWAKEREELSNLCAPWGSTENVYERPRNRPRYARLSMQNNDYVRKEPAVGSRRPSLPPLVPSSYKHHQPDVYVHAEKFDREMGGETSGYGSDNPNHTPEHFRQPPWGQTMMGGYESSSSYRDDRPKWGDRGVGVGKFWNPKDFNEYEKTMTTSDAPGWVKRGLQRDSELIVANSSPAESPEQQDFREQDRPCTGSSGGLNKTYIRGQNVPLEPTELAERERRRQIALEHQEAIRQQLEEREQRRKEEKERQIREEREEELRIEREQEIERRRKEQEEKLFREKQEREKKRKEAMREAMELAEKQAKMEKIKQKMSKHNININENVKEKEDNEPKIMLNNNIAATAEMVEGEVKQINLEQCNNNLMVSPKEENSHVCTNNNNNSNNKDLDVAISITDKVDNNQIINVNVPTVTTPRNDNLALVLQTPIETLQGMQFAVLVPSVGGTVTNNTLPIAVPIAITPSERTENRVLTPSLYRNRRFCDSSTQTEYLDVNRNDIDQKYLREKFSQLDIGYDRIRKDRRIRVDERARESVEDRPKWGANRPPTRYLKQSEKDPVYQRRKLRQKMRQIKTYEDKLNRYSPHSSDDSPTASPRPYRKKDYIENRHGRALWRKNEQMFARNVSVYQTEIVPLESDKDQIYYKQKCGHKCCCHCQTDRHYVYPDQVKVVDIMKIEHDSPRESVHYKSEITQNSERLPECNRNSSIDSTSDVIQKLNTLHNGLMLKQEQWEKSPQTPSLCSATKESPY